jgi:hypothetical protein
LRWVDPFGLLDPEKNNILYPIVQEDAAKRLDANAPPNTPTIPGMDRQQTIENLSQEVADRMTEEEAAACNPLRHPFTAGKSRKKVGERILEELKQEHPKYPWEQWEPFFDDVWK